MQKYACFFNVMLLTNLAHSTYLNTHMGVFKTDHIRIDAPLDSEDIYKIHQVGKHAYTPPDMLYKTFEIAYKCIQENISGDFVECGVAEGSQVALMAYVNKKYNSNKKIHLFDSFEGIPLAGPKDTAQPGFDGPIKHNTNVPLESLLKSSGVDVYSVEHVKNNMRRWGINQDYLLYYKGWFQHVLPEVHNKIGDICFLRLDGDLYESTKVCLEYFYPKVVTGGYVVIDDYGSLEGCKRAVTEYLNKNNLNPHMIVVDNSWGATYWVKE